ncbi:MAG: dehydrogenase [Flavobacteriaceae bacterium]|nr:MAG: dehydrogenase [Flavobacteriaceae bacterium]
MKNLISSFIVRIALYGFMGLFLACQQAPSEPSPPLSPAQALETFVLAEENLQIELVAAEPLVQNPVAITFDEDGRLWVVEMLGFMKDIDGNGELDQVGRISVLFDDDGDGQMDRNKIFLDSLVLPRAIAVVDGGILIAENIPLWYAEDTDGDFKADTKTLIDPEYGGLGMPEHSANGLWRGMDNWYYNAKSKSRYRKINGEWVKEPTEFRGQWGISHDNAGRLYYNYNWSQLHADIVPPNALMGNKNHIPTSGIDHGLTLEREIFPIRSNRAVNRGYVPGTLDDEGKLLEFASACGPLVFRGNAMPENYLGDAFVCEPTANLIKRNKVIEDGFMLSAEGVYKNREFLASTDERFRPISLASGPDGALYVVDMYKGIIQHGPYMTPYLREITLARRLDKPINMGRIWRISSKKDEKNNVPNLSGATPATLVNLLGDPNGWTRDMAQRLLVEQGSLSILPDLKKMVTDGNPLGQLHALWTLEGLHYLDADIYLTAIKTKDPKVAQAALRLLAKLLPQQPIIQKKIQQFIQNDFAQADPLLQMQMVFASSEIPALDAFICAQKFLETYGDNPIARDVVMSSLENREFAMFKRLISQSGWKTYDQNREIFLEMLTTGITNKGSSKEIKQLINILETKQDTEQLWIKTAIVNGMLNFKGLDDDDEITLASKPGFFQQIDLFDADTQPLLEKLQKALTWPGKPKVEAVATASHEIDQKVYSAGRQKYINICASCHGTKGEGMTRFAPPLKHSEWVTGDDYKLALILLYGMEGPVNVNGKRYDIPDILPSMPSFSTLQNEDIAAIMTYIRNSWGHNQSPVSSRTVGGIRFRSQGKLAPWNSVELDTLSFDINQ